MSRARCACLAVVTVCSGCSDGIRRDVAGKFLAAENCTVQVGATSRSAKAGDTVAAAGNVVTAETGRASIALLPNVLVGLGPATELQIRALALQKDGNETANAMRRRIAHVKLMRGELYASQDRRDIAAEPEFQIETAQGMAQSTFDCLFALKVNNERTEVTCASGWAYFKVRGAREATRVEPGQVLVTENDQKLRMFAAEANTNAQETLMDLAAANQLVNHLAASLVEAPPPWKTASRR